MLSLSFIELYCHFNDSETVHGVLNRMVELSSQEHALCQMEVEEGSESPCSRLWQTRRPAEQHLFIASWFNLCGICRRRGFWSERPQGPR